MRRDPCFGTCPIYNLTIYANGKVEYEGLGYVKIEGNRKSTISADKIEELVSAIDKAKFFSLEDQYVAGATDLPAVTLSITLNGKSKSVYHYGFLDCKGRFDDAPQELCELEDKIDEVVDSKRWINPD